MFNAAKEAAKRFIVYLVFSAIENAVIFCITTFFLSMQIKLQKHYLKWQGRVGNTVNTRV